MKTKLKRIFSKRWVWIVLSTLPFLCYAGKLYAQQGAYEQPVSKPILIVVSLVALALVPVLLTMVTSFVKIAVVLALIRNAMGTQQIPPNQVITGLAMILTLYIMIPVGLEIYREAGSVIQSTTSGGFFSQATVGLLKEAFEKGQQPVKTFLLRHAHDKERLLFFNLAKQMRQPADRDSLKPDDFQILIPSFVISELSEAFQIGFVIFLPFLVLDMVVANVLLSLGMFQLSPVTVSLPFKLLLFVLVDGWYLIARGLILGYAPPGVK